MSDPPDRQQRRGTYARFLEATWDVLASVQRLELRLGQLVAALEEERKAQRQLAEEIAEGLEQLGGTGPSPDPPAFPEQPPSSAGTDPDLIDNG